jgi:aspartyl-tRNA(Asn)/glutamyl-tRNA(Gln) amidotransferase subunit C
LTGEQVKKIANLAKLEFSDEELGRFIPTFEQILGYFEQLTEVDTDAVEPTYHALHGQEPGTPFREDACTQPLPRDKVLEQAPESSEGHFRVPRVIE